MKGSKEAVNPMNLKQANWINCTRTEPGLVLITRAGLESMQEAFLPDRLLRKEGVRVGTHGVRQALAVRSGKTILGGSG